MSNKPNLTPVKPKSSARPVPPSQDQEAITVSPEMLLAQIVSHIGEEFVIIPTDGWQRIVKTIQSSNDKDLAKNLENLGVPVVPISLSPNTKPEEESLIILPDDMPKGDSKIILATK